VAIWKKTPRPESFIYTPNKQGNVQHDIPASL
jgi:hypothetical protein